MRGAMPAALRHSQVHPTSSLCQVVPLYTQTVQPIRSRLVSVRHTAQHRAETTQRRSIRERSIGRAPSHAVDVIFRRATISHRAVHEEGRVRRALRQEALPAIETKQAPQPQLNREGIVVGHIANAH
eukprot:2749217-Prymnesium_polylepis.1